MAQPAPPSASSAFDVRHYAVRLGLDVASGTVTGHETIVLIASGDTRELAFDSGELTIDSASERGAPLLFTKDGRRLIVTLTLARPDRAGQQRRIDITYHGSPRQGLSLLREGSQAYTTFSTSQWMVAVDAPSERATLDLSVEVPAGWVAAGSGRDITRRALQDRATLYRWRQDRAVPSYTFGFAAGRFTEASDTRGGTTLRYLGTGFQRDELRRVFHDTADILAFFEERAGVPYPGESYTQVLVATSGGQEMAGLAHMSEAYGRAALGESGGVSLIAHELAHQWWGNMVTCRDWTHFWLNEGFATFMAAAFKERRLGREAYMADVGVWRARLEQLRAAGHDKPLVFPDWTRPSADDRALVYQKGALVLHELREVLGEATFWAAIRSYTRSHFGASVTTADFQTSMEASSGRPLAGFFDEWVYLTRPHQATR